ncbi:Helix-turn-helix [Alteribacillus persepolensis]|uniref:Helix-turn-helix n=1 Tax=Alteribacillus persepolensis TaxID=568899 RepID=A0A1G8I628_9BACI|nr:helix-turn-helix transcriptional regulator [Alteribacillus persepolensis]SDI14211.1 Helix-turn-helix [Alteribacillus persepolensis]
MDDINKAIGKRINYYRKQKRMTQEELAEKADLSKSYVSQMEAGKKNITTKTIYEIAQALRINPRFLFEKTDEIQISEDEKALVHYYQEWQKEGMTAEDVKRLVELAKQIRDFRSE